MCGFVSIQLKNSPLLLDAQLLVFRRVILSSLESDYHPFVGFKDTSVALNFIFAQLFLGVLVI